MSGVQSNGINPAAAKAYWLALPDGKRTLQAVADRFGVTGARISQIAKRDEWAKTLEALEDELHVQTHRELRRKLQMLSRDRAERIIRTLEVNDRVTDLALQKLPLGDDGQITPTDAIELEKILTALPGLTRMGELLAGEATDRIHVAEIQPVLVAFARIAVFHAPEAERPAVVAELEEASAGLIQIDAGAVA